MKRMIGKNINKLRCDYFQSKKPNKPNNSHSYKPVRIINSKKIINSSLKRFENYSNFCNTKFPIGFPNRTSQSSYINNISTINTNYTNNISKSVKTNKIPSKKKRISIIKKNNLNFNIQTLSNLWNKLNLFKEEQIKMNILDTSNSDVNNDKKKNQEKVIPKLPINNINNLNYRYYQRENQNSNNNNTNYSSFVTFEKFINNEKEDKKENEYKEKESEFLNYNLGHMKNISELSIHTNNNNENKQPEEKEINLNDLCKYYQNNKDNSSIIVNTNNNEQSFYCNDINEKKEGEDIHKIYYIAMHNN